MKKVTPNVGNSPAQLVLANQITGNVLTPRLNFPENSLLGSSLAAVTQAVVAVLAPGTLALYEFEDAASALATVDDLENASGGGAVPIGIFEAGEGTLKSRPVTDLGGYIYTVVVTGEGMEGEIPEGLSAFVAAPRPVSYSVNALASRVLTYCQELVAGAPRVAFPVLVIDQYNGRVHVFSGATEAGANAIPALVEVGSSAITVVFDLEPVETVDPETGIIPPVWG